MIGAQGMLKTTRIGHGPRPVILLHGFLGSGRNLATLARRWMELDPSQSFLMPDLPGHGESPPPSGAGISALARRLLDTVRNEGVEGPLHITGHSLGGRVGLAASLLEPESVEAVDLLDIAPGPIATESSESGRVLAKLLQAPDTAPDRSSMRKALEDLRVLPTTASWLVMNVETAPEGVRWRIDREALARLHKEVNAADLWPAVEHATAKIRCVRGGHSPYVSDEDARRMEAAGCPVATLPTAGHNVHVEALEPLARMLAGAAPWA